MYILGSSKMVSHKQRPAVEPVSNLISSTHASLDVGQQSGYQIYSRHWRGPHSSCDANPVSSPGLLDQAERMFNRDPALRHLLVEMLLFRVNCPRGGRLNVDMITDDLPYAGSPMKTADSLLRPPPLRKSFGSRLLCGFAAK